ncbi:MAG TPA: PAS domain-containing protein [Flavobacteriales bacterium]|nr:PAS domain-containing protein [Flavobacteriales bacterium]
MSGNIQAEALTENSLISLLFDTQPDSVVWFVPTFSQAGSNKPDDFEIGYCNMSTCLVLKVPKEKLIGGSLKSTDLIDEITRQNIWEQCLEVWTTGISKEYTYYIPVHDRYFNVQRSKLHNGILSIARDHTQYEKMRREREQQTQLLNQIIETSASGISLYESIRDKEGNISDFKLVLANQKCAEITAFTLEELYKYTVKELMVIRGRAAFFDMLTKVVETGEPMYTEYYSEERHKWIAFAVKKFNDGYLLHYIDITQTKQLEKHAKDQADMLKSILDSSISGLMTIQAVYDSAGKIEDFRFIMLNKAAEQLFRLKEGDKHKSYLTVFPNAKSNGFFDFYVGALKTGKPVTKEFFYKGEGYNGWYYISVSKMNDDTLVQSFTDITHAKDKPEL